MSDSTTDYQNTPKIFVWIINAINILTLVTAIIFLIFVILFIIRGSIFLAIFEGFFCLLFLIITVTIRKLRSSSFRQEGNR